MSELVKQAHNSDANKNYTPVITKQHNIKQMQQNKCNSKQTTTKKQHTYQTNKKQEELHM